MIHEARRKRKSKDTRRVPIVLVSYFLFVLVIAWYFENQATSTLIVVRHAEKAAQPADDPPLSRDGQLRAYLLADVLSDVDVVAGVDAIFVTHTRRSEETARPLANRLKLPLNYYEPQDYVGLQKAIDKSYKGKIVLVIAHSNTIPGLVAEFSGSKKIKPIGENQYYDMFILSRPWFGKVKTLALKYGQIGNSADEQDEPPIEMRE
jgi:2,3-bisphosphoglycerate-dependent phosphoglycerate mutase